MPQHDATLTGKQRPRGTSVAFRMDVDKNGDLESPLSFLLDEDDDIIYEIN